MSYKISFSLYKANNYLNSCGWIIFSQQGDQIWSNNQFECPKKMFTPGFDMSPHSQNWTAQIASVYT